MEAPFLDRADAGRQLAGPLQHYAGRSEAIVLALPRGGVPVAYQVARALRLPLDIFLVRKLGVPGHEELAMGAIASGGTRVLNQDVVGSLRIPAEVIEQAAAREQRELERREHEYRDGRPATRLRGRTVILVDDGLATGSTMLAAIGALRREQAARIVVAVPVAALRTCAHIRELVDEIVCLKMPADFQAVGEWYDDFAQTTDAEVRELLRLAARESDIEHAGRK